MATYQELKAMNLSEVAIRAALDAEAMEAYNGQNSRNGDFQENNGAKVNLLSAMSQAISKIAYEGTANGMPQEYVDKAVEYQNFIETEGNGNLANLNLSRELINAALNDLNYVAESEYSHVIEGEYGLVRESAEIVSSGKSDEQLAEEFAIEERESRNSEKEEAPTLTRQNPSTGDLMVLVDGVWKTDDGSVEFSEMHLDAIKQEANQEYNEAIDNGSSDSDYMQSLEER